MGFYICLKALRGWGGVDAGKKTPCPPQVWWSKCYCNPQFTNGRMINESLSGLPRSMTSKCHALHDCTALPSNTLWCKFNHNTPVSHVVLLPLKPWGNGRWVVTSRPPWFPSLSSWLPFSFSPHWCHLFCSGHSSLCKLAVCDRWMCCLPDSLLSLGS